MQGDYRALTDALHDLWRLLDRMSDPGLESTYLASVAGEMGQALAALRRAQEAAARIGAGMVTGA